MNPTPEQFLAALALIEKLSPAPKVLGKVLALLRNVDSSLQDIEELIRVDSALTTDIVKSANSLLYGSGEKVTSLDRALQRVGFKESIRLVNLSVAKTVSRRELIYYGITAEDYWSESLFNGLLMESLANATQMGDPSEAYTAGLLRYVGRLVINEILRNMRSDVLWDGLAQLDGWERETIGLTHADVGAKLLRAWNLPEAIVEAIGNQNVIVQEGQTLPPLSEALVFCTQVQAHRAEYLKEQEALDNWDVLLAENNYAQKNRITKEVMNSVWAHSQRNLELIKRSLTA